MMEQTFIKKGLSLRTRTNRRLSLPYTRSEYRLLWNLQAFLGCCVLGSLIFLGWSTFHYYEVIRQIDLESNSLSRIRSAKHIFKETMTRDGLTLSSSELEDIKKKITFANRLNHKKSFSWATLLSELSKAIPTGASIQSVHVRFEDSVIMLNGKVKTLEKLNLLIENLQHHKMFRNAKVSNHRFEDYQEKPPQALQAQHDSSNLKTYSIVQFNLSVDYRPIFAKEL